MSGRRTDVPEGYPQTFYLGLCDHCRTAKQFLSAEARDYWEANHQEHEAVDE